MKKLFALWIAILIVVTVSIPVAVAQTESPRLIDQADLLQAQEEQALLTKLDQASEEYQVDFVIVTVDTMGEDVSVDEFAELVYEEGDYGFNETKDGVMLLVAMEEREWHILTNGLGKTAITDSEAESIGDAFSSYLSDQDYVNGFNVFFEECEYQINGEINGFPFPLGRNLLIALVIGFVLAFIVTGIWKSQLKSVRSQKNATVYTKQGSMNITTANDFYLYSTVTRKAKPQKSSSSGGSSGGSSRGGASGSF